MEIIQNYINGQLQAPLAGDYIDNYEPATGQVYGKIPRSQADDVDAAVKAADAAFPAWSALSIQERSAYLRKISEAIDAKLHLLAEAESRDNGKPIKLAAAVDIPRARDNFSFFATAILHQEDEFHNMGEKGFNYTLRQPIGTVACISPWNLPLYLFTWKIAPALASGNCVVAKPSEVTPFTAFLLAQICIEVGLPAGVLNIVHGLGAETGQAMVEHPQVKAISFTGGTATGARIASIAAPQFKKLSLELGGKNPNIIFADCDIERAINISARAAFANQGQICLCGSRIFIERAIYEDFKKGFLQRVEGMKVGPPQEASSRMGALVSKDHLEKVYSYILLAQEEGGKILAGGNKLNLPAPYDKGYYLEPTVIEGLAFDCRTNQEEIFGPVVTLTPFDSEEEVLMMANSTEYGLACTIFTENLNKAHRVAKEVHTGIVWINDWLVRDLRTPFGGMKNSGVGREGGFEALKFFTESKNVCLNYY
jgi:aminomuconate-semialdehyde/2-hydroxymuconate-6-semialdehyde dehydrogenase